MSKFAKHLIANYVTASMGAMALLIAVTRFPVLLNPINEGHRNAQTATLTAGMIESGHLRLDPIAPWRGDLAARVAQELPVYNLAALSIYSMSGVPIDMAGRIASLLFWLLSFVALQALWRRTLAPQSRLWANLLFVLAPMNWYLSTAFMPESLLQLLAIGFMIGVLGYALRPNPLAFMLLFLTGLLGLLVKFPGFVHLGLFAALVLVDRGGIKMPFQPALMAGGLLIVATVAAWGGYVKLVNAPYFADWSGWENIVGFIRPQSSRFSLNYYLPLMGYNAAFIATALGLPFVVWGTWQYFRTFRTHFSSRVWIYLLGSLAVSWLVWGKGAPSQNYYNLPNLVFVCAAFGNGVAECTRILRRSEWTMKSLNFAGGCLAFALLAQGLAGYCYLSRPDRVTVAAAEWVKANTQPGDLIIYQPLHSPAVIDYQHQPLLSHLSGRRTWIWTRTTPQFEKDRALVTASYAIITHPPYSMGTVEALRRKFKGSPAPLPPTLQEENPNAFREVFTTGDFTVMSLRG